MSIGPMLIIPFSCRSFQISSGADLNRRSSSDQDFDLGLACFIVRFVHGPHWLTSTDEEGRRRLNTLEDFPRIEITTALS
jgi:hypothetical protein